MSIHHQARPQPAADDNSIWAVLHRMTEYGTDDKASAQTLYLEALTLLSAGYGKGRANGHELFPNYFPPGAF